MSTTPCYIGIDPGMNGGIAVWSACKIEALLRLSTSTDKEICDFIESFKGRCVYAVIEKVSAMKGQGVSSTFKFGKAYGSLAMALVAYRIPHEHVTPQSWQKGLGIPANIKGDERKRSLKQVAEQRFPDIKLVLETADAPLIAEYASNQKSPF
jgi:hypothetical protein